MYDIDFLRKPGFRNFFKKKKKNTPKFEECGLIWHFIFKIEFLHIKI